MEKIIKVDEYCCISKAPDYMDEAFHINIILEKTRSLFNIWFPKETIKNIDYGIYIYEDKSFNAFSAKKDKGYVIAFSTTCLQQILKISDEMFSKKEVLELFHLQKDNDRIIHYYKSAIIDYMTRFIALHEFYHILNGHCGKSSITNELNTENIIDSGNTKINFYKQLLEMDADSSAATTLATDIVMTEIKCGTFSKPADEPLTDDDMIRILEFSREIEFLVFSIYVIFLLFAANKKLNIKKALDNLLTYSHPLPSIRMAYTLPCVVDVVSKVLSENEQKVLFNRIFNKCVAYDRIFYAKGDFSQSLQALGNTEKAVQLRMELNNGWNEIIPILKNNAILPLHEREIITELPYWVDENGNILTNSSSSTS